MGSIFSSTFQSPAFFCKSTLRWRSVAFDPSVRKLITWYSRKRAIFLKNSLFNCLTFSITTTSNSSTQVSIENSRMAVNYSVEITDCIYCFSVMKFQNFRKRSFKKLTPVFGLIFLCDYRLFRFFNRGIVRKQKTCRKILLKNKNLSFLQQSLDILNSSKMTNFIHLSRPSNP